MIGTSLSHYRITEKLGAGGMGEVYRAEDTSLRRFVAIKVLPYEFAQDAERLARFQREAQVLASLNHPNIATLYGLEESGGKRFIVMELVEGQTLAHRLQKGPFPVEEALEVCRQIAEGLEAAHEKGVIHRDLKPANVKITPEGKVKVLDFGLAKALTAESAPGDVTHSPTITEAATHAGTILGTAAYMSPEQARGAAVDKRSDIWAFGVVLFEMLAGRPCFDGDTVTDLLAAIVKSEPDWHVLPAATPWRVREMLQHCLAKDRSKRLHDIADARLQIEETIARPADFGPNGRHPGKGFSALPWILLAVMTCVAAALALMLLWRPEPRVRPTTRLRIPLPAPVNREYGGRMVAISPDGTQIVYIGGQAPSIRMYYRGPADLDFKAVAGSQGALDPFFSPDGKSIGFFADGRFKRLRVATGQIDDLSGRLESTSRGGIWGNDQAILFARNLSSGIYKLTAFSLGVAPELVVPPDANNNERGLQMPQRLPVEDLILFTAAAGDIASMDDARIVIGRLDDKSKRWTLTSSGSDGRYLPTGHLAYGRDGKLMVAPLDIATRTIKDPVIALDGVLMFQHTGQIQYAVADSGDLVYIPGNSSQTSTSLVLIDRNGNEQALNLPSNQSVFISSLNVSPNGQRMAILLHKANDDIHVYEFSSGSLPRVTFEKGDERSPVWVPPNNQRLAYSSESGPIAQMFISQADGSGKPEPLFPGDKPRYPHSFSPDGKILAFEEIGGIGGWDIWTGTMGAGGQAKPFLNTANSESYPAFSPDGQWIAYQSDESGGQPQVFAIKYPEGSSKQQVSQNGGTEPRWAASGKELFYRNGDEMIAVDVNLSPTLSLGRRRVLFRTRPGITRVDMPPWWSYAVMPDGRRFIFKDSSKSTPPINEIILVLNWFEELVSLVPTGK